MMNQERIPMDACHGNAYTMADADIAAIFAARDARWAAEARRQKIEHHRAAKVQAQTNAITGYMAIIGVAALVAAIAADQPIYTVANLGLFLALLGGGLAIQRK